MPTNLYRYSRLDTPQAAEYLKDLLKNNRFWCASPADFNDPFEIRPLLEQDVLTNEFRENYFKFGRDFFRPKMGQMSENELTRELEKTYELISRDPTLLPRLHNVLRSIGICCLSELENSLLMWAHYAKGHNGYCLEFDSLIWSGNTQIVAYPVEYTEAYPAINIWPIFFEGLKPVEQQNAGIYDDFAKRSVLKKSPEWGYEKEWRIINSEPGYVDFNRQSLKRLIFGVSAKTDVIADIKNILRENKSTVKVFHAELDKESFRLNYIDIT